MSVEYTQGAFVISTDPARLDIPMIHRFLSTESYWAKDVPFATIERAIAHSLCFGLYNGTTQVGFARVVSDTATFAYVSDVFILPSHQGQGLGTWLITCIRQHPDLQGLRRWTLATRDAHGLYQRVGFEPLRAPERWMEIWHPHIYSEPQ